MTSTRILEFDPTLRMLCGMALLLGVLLTDTAHAGGMAAAALPAGAALLLHRRHPVHLLRVILIGSVLYLPALLWAPAGVAIKGMSAALALMAPATALSAQETSTIIMRLPLPVSIRFLLLQVIHQTGVLGRETRTLFRAVSIRGGVHGIRSIAVFSRALPESWLPRVAVRAERVAMAMAVRGYGDRLPQAAPIVWSATARSALACSIALSTVVVLYSYLGAA